MSPVYNRHRREPLTLEVVSPFDSPTLTFNLALLLRRKLTMFRPQQKQWLVAHGRLRIPLRQASSYCWNIAIPRRWEKACSAFGCIRARVKGFRDQQANLKSDDIHTTATTPLRRPQEKRSHTLIGSGVGRSDRDFCLDTSPTPSATCQTRLPPFTSTDVLIFG